MKRGDRVRFRYPVERFAGVVPKGATGTIVFVGPDPDDCERDEGLALEVRLDHPEGCDWLEEWNGLCSLYEWDRDELAALEVIE